MKTLLALMTLACLACSSISTHAAADSRTVPSGTVEPVRFDSHGITLAGLLTHAGGQGPHAAIVLIHGSGEGLAQNPYLLTLAQAFASEGFDVLTFDKRGQGKSGGTFYDGRYRERAADLLSAVAYLRKRSDVNPGMVGVWGISQAGWVIPLAVQQSHAIAFAILVSPAGVNPFEQMLYERSCELRDAGVSETVVKRAEALRRTVGEYYMTRQGYARAQQVASSAFRQGWLPEVRAVQELREVSEEGRIAPPSLLARLYAMRPTPWNTTKIRHRSILGPRRRSFACLC